VCPSALAAFQPHVPWTPPPGWAEAPTSHWEARATRRPLPSGRQAPGLAADRGASCGQHVGHWLSLHPGGRATRSAGLGVRYRRVGGRGAPATGRVVLDFDEAAGLVRRRPVEHDIDRSHAVSVPHMMGGVPGLGATSPNPEAGPTAVRLVQRDACSGTPLRGITGGRADASQDAAGITPGCATCGAEILAPAAPGGPLGRRRPCRRHNP
jgi:hypothetical protein